MANRNFRAEYKRRIRNALARGLSRSQARGHPRAAENSAADRTTTSAIDPVLERVLKAVRSGKSLTEAAREHRVGRERASAYIKRVAGASRQGRTWTFNDQRRRRVSIYSEGERRDLWVGSYEQAVLAGRYWDDAHRAISDDGLKPEFERKYDGLYVRDTRGRWHPLETDLNAVHRLAYAYPEPFEQIYQLVAV